MFVGLFDDCVCNDNALPKRGGLIIGGSEEGGEVLSRVGGGTGRPGGLMEGMMGDQGRVGGMESCRREGRCDGG
eukprot:3287990-Rhodomonas_salina.1